MWSKKIIIFICIFYYAECFHVFAKSMKKKKPQTPLFYGFDRGFFPANTENRNLHFGQVLPFPICPYGMQSYGFPYGMKFMGNVGLNSRYLESMTRKPNLRSSIRENFEEDESEECESEEELEVEKPRKTQKTVNELTRACEKIAALCPEVETKNTTESKEKEELKSLLREFVLKYNAIKNKNCYKRKRNDENFEELDEISDEEAETCKNDNESVLNEEEHDNKRNGKSRIVFIGKSKSNVTNKH